VGDLRAEWLRLWSLRSPWACLIGALFAFAVCALSLANDAVRALELGEVPPGTMTAAADVLGPATQVGIVPLIAFAMLTVTAEYASGAIRTTLLGRPRRWRALAAKTAVVAVPAGVVIALATAGGWFAAAAILGERFDATGGPVGLAMRTGLLGAFVAVLAAALAALVRSSAATLAAGTAVLLGTLVVPGPIGGLLPAAAAASWVEQGAPTSLVVLAAWTAILWAVGASAMMLRDV
jgi:ABC-2 type transport system permease protein